MTRKNASGHAKLLEYLRQRFEDELADGWFLATLRDRIVLAKGGQTVDIDLPSHLRVVEDTTAWHQAHQTGRHCATIGLPLFAEREIDTQGALL